MKYVHSPVRPIWFYFCPTHVNYILSPPGSVLTSSLLQCRPTLTMSLLYPCPTLVSPLHTRPLLRPLLSIHPYLTLHLHSSYKPLLTLLNLPSMSTNCSALIASAKLIYERQFYVIIIYTS